jgi:hypothetical protein
MPGFINLAADLGYSVSVIVALICFLAGAGFVLGGLWGIYRVVRSEGRLRLWAPIAGIFIGSALLSFDKLLNAANATLGSSHTASMSSLTSYTPPSIDPNGIVGATPQQTWLNIINLFDPFFMAYGAAIVLWALLEAKGMAQGHRRYAPSRVIVHFTFGVFLLNIDFVAPAIMSYFA